jgi:P-type Ca2+ transporter type 2C
MTSINSETVSPPTPDWHILDPGTAAAKLGVPLETGLAEEEAAARLANYGPNRRSPFAPVSRWRSLLDAVWLPPILILVASIALLAWMDKFQEMLLILGLFLIQTALYFWLFRRINRANETLNALNEPAALVRRAGRCKCIPADNVVPGDILILVRGRRIPADARLLEAFSLQVDESSLTSVKKPVDKDPVGFVLPSAPVAERLTMVFAGTLVTRGRGLAVVTATGEHTAATQRLGQGVGTTPAVSHLDRELKKISRRLVWLTAGVSLLITLAIVWLRTLTFSQELLFVCAVLFAFYLGDIPLLLKLNQAVSAYRLARQRAVVKAPQVIERLDEINTILSDKTGTLTANRPQLLRCMPSTWRNRLLDLAILAVENNLILSQNSVAPTQPYPMNPVCNDPLDAALARAVLEAGLDPSASRQNLRLVEMFTFDNTRQRFSAVYHKNGHRLAVIKGAPEAVLEVCTRRWTNDGEDDLLEVDREAILDSTTHLASAGNRVLALAERTLPVIPGEVLTPQFVEQNLTFAGLLAFGDPQRPEAPAVIAACRAAGIRVILVSGDHPAAVRAAASASGIALDPTPLVYSALAGIPVADLHLFLKAKDVFARVPPALKNTIVQAMMQSGERLAVTGDGINDIPSLLQAHVGVAMGESGTDAARAAADLVLADDNLETLLNAITEGRRFSANLSKAFVYYLGSKLSLAGILVLSMLGGLPFMFSPIQIFLGGLLINLISLTVFVAEPAEPGLNHLTPHNPLHPFWDRAKLLRVVSLIVGLFVAFGLAYSTAVAAHANMERARTTAYFAWLFALVLVAYSQRTQYSAFFRIPFGKNPVWLVWSTGLVLSLLLINELPSLGVWLNLVPLATSEWILAIVAAGFGLLLVEIGKILTWVMFHPSR